MGSLDSEVPHVRHMLHGINKGGHVGGCMEERRVLRCEYVTQF